MHSIRRLCTGFCVLIAVSVPSSVSAQPISILCNGTQVGTMELTPTDNFVSGEFRVTSGLTLASAAEFCGEDHFNWLQIVLFARHAPVDSGGQPLGWPFVDPPSGGYGDDPNTPGDDTLWADAFPYYWNGGPDPPDGTPGFKSGLSLDDNSTLDTLNFLDVPQSPFDDQFIVFFTLLASVNADGSLHSIHCGYLWTWETTDSGDTVSSFQAVPEPNTLALIGTGTAICWSRRRHLFNRR